MGVLPQRGDIAVIDSGGTCTTRIIKRVVAVGGDMVIVSDGELRINGERFLEEEYIKEPYEHICDFFFIPPRVCICFRG